MRSCDLRSRVDRAAQFASGHWREIFLAAGVEAYRLSGKACPCPMCGGVDRFVFDDKHGRGNYFCRQCGAGDGFRLLGRYLGCGFIDALEYVENYFALESWDKESQKSIANEDLDEGKLTPQQRQRHKMLSLWAQAKPIQRGDPVYLYLQQRGVNPETAGLEIRCHERLVYQDEDSEESFHPAMLSRVIDSHGCVVNLHRTYLTESGQKAPVAHVKKLMPLPVAGAAVHIGGIVGKKLCFSEGIETALAVCQMTGMPVWATLGCMNLKAFEGIPEGVREVDIFADNDANFAGQSAAYQLANALSIRGLRVQVYVPQHEGFDWLDEALQRKLF